MAIDVGLVGGSTTPTTFSLYRQSQIGRDYLSRVSKADSYFQSKLASGYIAAFEEAERALTTLMQKEAAAIAAGESPGLSWTLQETRLKSLLSQYQTAIKSFEQVALSHVYGAQRAGLQAALAYTPELLKQYAGTAPVGVMPAGFGPEVWAQVNQQAMIAVTSMFAETKSPLRAAMAAVSEDAMYAVRNALQKGILLGQNPLKIASRIKAATANIALGRARVIARTEFHRAYRQANREQYARSDVITGWVWMAKLDLATCPVCIAMAGRLFDKEEMLDGHPACRCVMVPMTKRWQDLFPGLNWSQSGAYWDVPGAMSVPRGSDWFGSQLSRDAQKAILGPTRYEMMKDRLITGESYDSILASFVRQTDSAVWGPMKTLQPLKAPPRVVPPPPPPAPTMFAGTPTAYTKKNMPPANAFWAPVTPAGTVSYTQAQAAKDAIAKQIAAGFTDDALIAWNGRVEGFTGYLLPRSGIYGYGSINYPAGKMQWAELTEAEKRAMLAMNGEAIKQTLASQFIHNWAATSGDDSPLAILFQARSKEIFQLQAFTGHFETRSGWAGFTGADAGTLRVVDEFLTTMYKETQAMFAREGITEMTLARGVSFQDKYVPTNIQGMQTGESMVATVDAQPMSSWSTRLGTASGFAGTSSGWSGKQSFVMKSTFPVEWIIGSARSGFGCLSEYEVVVLCPGPFEAFVTKK